jgi:hypothetical protein
MGYNTLGGVGGGGTPRGGVSGVQTVFWVPF